MSKPKKKKLPAAYLRIQRKSRIPQRIQPMIDQIMRLQRDLIKGYRHFREDPSHWRDGPAKRRLQANADRLRRLMSALEEKDSGRAAAVRAELQRVFLEEGVHVQAED